MPYDLNTAKSRVTDYTTKKYGRGPQNDQEWAQIGDGINYGDGVDDDELNRAFGNADRLAGSIGNGNRQPNNLPNAGPQLGPVGVPNTIPNAGPRLPGSGGGDFNFRDYNSGTQAPTTIQRAGGFNWRDFNSGTQAPGAVPPSGGFRDRHIETELPSGATGGPNIPPNLRELLGGLFNPRPPSPWELQAQQALQQILTRGSSTPSITDPTLQPVSDAYRSGQQRNYERLRSAAAERAAQDGTLQSGGFDAEALGYLQDTNAQSAAFDANLVREEVQARREELVTAIQIANQMGQFDQAQQLQQQLALLDGALRQQGMQMDFGLRSRGLDLQEQGMNMDFGLRSRGLDIQQMLGRGDLDFRQRGLDLQGQLGRGDLGLRLLQSLLQNDQFFSQLGLSAAQIQAILNQSAVQSILGGGV